MINEDAIKQQAATMTLLFESLKANIQDTTMDKAMPETAINVFNWVQDCVD